MNPVEAKLAGQDTSEKITANADIDKSVLGGFGDVSSLNFLSSNGSTS